MTEGGKWRVLRLGWQPQLQVGLFVSASFSTTSRDDDDQATGAVTSSVANTAKRVIVMVYMAAVTGKQLTEEQKIGAAVAIGFVLVYSVIDDLLKATSSGKSKSKSA